MTSATQVRNLSRLQRRILGIAATNRASGKRSAAAGDVSTCELLAMLFGWPFERDFAEHLRHFKRRRIGELEYAAGYASISQSLRRLKERGLAVLWHRDFMDSTNIVLTQAGYEIGRAGSDLPPWSQVNTEVDHAAKDKRLAELEAAVHSE